MVYPEDRVMLRQRVERLFAGETDTRDYRILTRSGETRWLRDTVRPARPSNAEGVLLVYGMARDITDERHARAVSEPLVAQARAAQREANNERQRLRELFRHAPAIIAITYGPEHVFEFVNPAYECVSGRAARDTVGHTSRAVFPETPRAALSAALDHVYRSGEPFIGTEARVVYDRDGHVALEEGYVNFVYQPTKDVGGKTRGHPHSCLRGNGRSARASAQWGVDCCLVR